MNAAFPFYRFFFKFEQTGLCIGPCECTWLTKMNLDAECKFMDEKAAKFAGFRGQNTVMTGNELLKDRSEKVRK